MAFTRQDRTLSGGKSNVPLIRKGVPDSREGFHGDIAFVEIDGIGIIQYIKIENIWKKVGSQSNATTQAEAVKEKMVADEEEVNFDTSGLIKADGSVPFTGNQSHGGFNITSVGSLTASATVQAEQLTSTDDAQIGDNLTVVGDINVDGEAKLDKTTIDTADGAFTASGANPISLTTTGTNDITLTTAQKLDFSCVNYDLVSTRTCDWDTASVDWDNSETFTLTSVDNVTIETSGADTAKTILLFNDNNNASAFRGIHLKTDSGNISSSQNSIFLECDNRSSKGGGDGIDIRSEAGILIRAEDPNTGTSSNIQIRATNHIDLQGGTASISPTGDAITRVKVHGVTEIMQLYRPSGSSITTNLDTITSPFGGSPETGHTEFEAINTQHLLRAITYKASGTVTNGNTLTIVSDANDDNAAGTVWQISVVYYYSTSKFNFQIFYVYFTAAGGSVYNDIVTDVNDINGGSTAGTLSWDASNGIRWTNNDGQNATVKASALRIQSSDDF